MRRLILLLAFTACGGTPIDDRLPIDPFEPGSERPGSYGSGSGAGTTTPPGPPMCGEAARRCAHEFRYAGSPALPLTGAEQSVTLIGDFAPDGWTVGRPMTFAAGAFTVTTPVPWGKPVIYKFKITYSDGTPVRYTHDAANPTQVDDGFGGKNSVNPGQTCVTWTCESTQIQCPGGAVGGFDWRDAVLYFVLVDRFLDGDAGNNAPLSTPGLPASTNWKGGDWAGVTQRILDGYFTSLGVNALWLSVPFDQSDQAGIGDDGRLYSAYHGYWPKDLDKTEDRLGSSAALETLIDEAHKAGIKIIFDYAMNHVHVDSPVYQAHQNDGWFWDLKLNGQDCVCGTAQCTWGGAQAKRCWFRDYLPDFDFTNAQARAFSVNNAIQWIKTYQVDGFRLDALKHIELSWLTDLRQRLTTEVEGPLGAHVYLVGETFDGDRALLKSFVDPCRMLDGQFDFPLRAKVLDHLLGRRGQMKDLADFMDGNDNFYGDALMSTFIGNHDVPRPIHFAEDAPLWADVWANGKDRNFDNPPGQPGGAAAYERLALGMALLYTSRGVPLLYYGDEIGLAGAGDPDNRRVMPWSGYSPAQSALLDRLKKLGTLRGAHPALRRGQRATLELASDVWVYEMKDGVDRVVVALNRADAARTAKLPAGAWRDEMTGQAFSGPTVQVPARGFLILTPQ
jgi:glycosidase